MAGVTEAAGSAATPIGGVLVAGVDTISLDQQIVFTQYVRLVLPVDGYVFLVRADLVSTNPYWEAAQAAAQALELPLTITAQGSLHYATDNAQDEDRSQTTNTVVFTSEQEVSTLNTPSPLIVYMGVIDDIQFAFSARKPFYRQADLWHYTGVAVLSDMKSQVIDDPSQIDTADVIVSNSLPLWLQLQGYDPAVALHDNPAIPLFPSFVVPDNLPPPYGVVHIEPGDTRGVASAPYFGPNLTQSQLCVDRVRVTLYGYRNNAALDFLAWVQQYSLFTQNFGIMNIAVVRDEKRGQVELNAIAQKKVIDFEVNYYQTRVNDVARQLITSAPVTFGINPL